MIALCYAPPPTWEIEKMAHEYSNGCCTSSVNRYTQPTTLGKIATDIPVSPLRVASIYVKFFPKHSTRRQGGYRYILVPPILAGMLYEEGQRIADENTNKIFAPPGDSTSNDHLGEG